MMFDMAVYPYMQEACNSCVIVCRYCNKNTYIMKTLMAVNFIYEREVCFALKLYYNYYV